MPLYIFLNSLFHKQGMLGGYHGYNRDTAWIQRGYNADTTRELGKFTYPKTPYVLYVSLYFYAILLRLLYRNGALGFPKV